MNVNQVNESYIYQYNKIYDQYIKNQEKITMTLLNQAVVDDIGANYNDQDYKSNRKKLSIKIVLLFQTTDIILF